MYLQRIVGDYLRDRAVAYVDRSGRVRERKLHRGYPRVR